MNSALNNFVVPPALWAGDLVAGDGMLMVWNDGAVAGRAMAENLGTCLDHYLDAVTERWHWRWACERYAEAVRLGRCDVDERAAEWFDTRRSCSRKAVRMRQLLRKALFYCSLAGRA